MAELRPGDPAPPFDLRDQAGASVTLADYRGRKLLLYFYPKADTPGCTREAIAFSELKPAFTKANTEVVGVSADKAKTQGTFKKKHNLKTALASDETHKILEAYGVWKEKSMYGRKYTTVLIGPEGRIARVWPKVKVEGHADEVLAAARALKG